MVTPIQSLRGLPLRLTQDLCGNLLNETNAKGSFMVISRCHSSHSCHKHWFFQHTVGLRSSEREGWPISPHVYPCSYKPHVFSISPNPAIWRKQSATPSCIQQILQEHIMGHYVCHGWKSNHVFLLSKCKKFQVWPGLSDSNAACRMRLGWVNTDGK